MDAVINAAGKHKTVVEAAAAAKAQAEADAKAKANIVIPAGLTLPTVPGTPSLLTVQVGQKQPLPIGQTQIVQTKPGPSSPVALTSDGSLAQAMAGASQSVAAAGMMKESSKVASAKQDALQSSTADWGIYSSFIEEHMQHKPPKVRREAMSYRRVRRCSRANMQWRFVPSIKIRSSREPV